MGAESQSQVGKEGSNAVMSLFGLGGSALNVLSMRKSQGSTEGFNTINSAGI